jgi:hypothetical protein
MAMFNKAGQLQELGRTDCKARLQVDVERNLQPAFATHCRRCRAMLMASVKAAAFESAFPSGQEFRRRDRTRA